MAKFLEKVKQSIDTDSKYPKLLSWERKGPAMKIQDCINSFSAGKTLIAFSKEVNIDPDRLFALSQIVISLIPVINTPKAIADYTVDFDGNYDFQFIVDDYMKILKNKKPTSRPKNILPDKKYVPIYKESRVSYTFGLEYNTRTKLWRLRCKLYPQKSWWGFRFEEKYRSFDELLLFVTRDLLRYYQDDQEEINILEDSEDLEEDLSIPEEDDL